MTNEENTQQFQKSFEKFLADNYITKNDSRFTLLKKAWYAGAQAGADYTSNVPIVIGLPAAARAERAKLGY